MPSQFAQRLLERSPLETAHYKALRRFNQVFPGFLLRPSLRSDVQGGTVRNVPSLLLLDETEELELSLNDFAHLTPSTKRFSYRSNDAWGVNEEGLA
jgi:hypothetical protein